MFIWTLYQSAVELILLHFSGWVHTVYYHDLGNEDKSSNGKGFSFSRAQRASVGVNRTTYTIVTAHYTCLSNKLPRCI